MSDKDLAVKVKDVVKQFGTRRALDTVSFDLPAGAWLSIFGANGAGKTTLLRCISTLSRPSKGSIELLGVDALKCPEEVRAKIGLISHQSMIYTDLTAAENLTFFADLYGVDDSKDRVSEMLDLVELGHRANDRAGTFSRGMTQRLSIARALINDPELVFLDEPYSGLDPHAVVVFDRLLDRVREDRTFIMVSHDIEKGYDLCDHALVLSHGRVVKFSHTSNLERAEFEEIYMSAVGKGGK